MPRVESLSSDVRVEICVGDKALTVSRAKEIIGWMSEEEYKKAMVEKYPDKEEAEFSYEDDYFILDTRGQKVRCWNNSRNRPFTESWARSLGQDILHSGPKINKRQRRWQFNCETIVVSDKGNVTSGQHRIVGLILAGQAWEDEEHWKDYWPFEPTIETLLAFGASEEDYVLRTMDNVKPRSLSDVLYTMDVYPGLPGKEKQKLCKALDYAVKLVWYRSGQGLDAFAPRRTHAEAVNFVNRHPKLVECVRVIHKISKGENPFKDDTATSEGEEKKTHESRLEDYIGLGYAAGLLYLMASSESDITAYENEVEPGEKLLIFTRWDQAVNFWMNLAFNDPYFKPLRMCRRPVEVIGDDAGEYDGYIFTKTGGGSVAERTTCVVKAWLCHIQGQNLTSKRVTPEYKQDSEGAWHMVETPSCGGIDLGDPNASVVQDLDEQGAEEYTPTEEEIEENKKKIKEEKLKKKKKKLKEQAEEV